MSSSPSPAVAVAPSASTEGWLTRSSARWTGRVLSGLCVAMMSFGAVSDLLRLPAMVEGAVKMGYPPTVVPWLGGVIALCIALYLLPRTSVLGAVLFTGYFGGAVATHVRAGDPVGRMLIPIYMSVALWLGLWLRDARVRALLPFGK